MAVYNMIGGNGSRYSLLTVVTDEPTLQSAAVTVTATLDGKTDTQTKHMVNGTVVFKLRLLTTYLITCETATPQTLDIPYYYDYTARITLKYWLYDGDLGEEGETGANVWVDHTGGYHHFTAPTWNSDHVRLGNGGAYGSSITTVNKISCAGYSKLKCLTYSDSRRAHCGISNTTASSQYNYNYITPVAEVTLDGGDTLEEIDLTNYQEQYFVFVRSPRYQSPNYYYGSLAKMWLE